MQIMPGQLYTGKKKMVIWSKIQEIYVERGIMTIKTIAVAHKKAGMTTGEFNKYWLEQHSPLAARLFPGLRKYVQNHFVIEPGRKYEGDGIVEMWFDDLAAMKNAMAFVHT
ncbi:MAG: hypothetical protein A2Y90_02960, partial [Chloroflexi bacterium RBG_13_52_12]